MEEILNSNIHYTSPFRRGNTAETRGKLSIDLAVESKLNPEFLMGDKLYEEEVSSTQIQLVSNSEVCYVLKRVWKRKLFSEESRISAERELEIHRQLSHPNIVHLYSVAETADEFLYLLEYLPNACYFVDKLEVNNKPLMLKPDGDLLKLKSFAFDVLAGLQYLHSLNIAHMDIKPANLLLSTDVESDEYFRVKICDFGLARQLGPDGKLLVNIRFGTEMYIAPEVQPGAHVTTACDMWSFGIFLHLLVFGYTPSALNWKRNQPLPVCKRHWKKYEGTQLEDLVRSCLQRDPERRITAKQALAHPFLRS